MFFSFFVALEIFWLSLHLLNFNFIHAELIMQLRIIFLFILLF